MKTDTCDKDALALIEKIALKTMRSPDITNLQQALNDIHAIARYRMPVAIE